MLQRQKRLHLLLRMHSQSLQSVTTLAYSDIFRILFAAYSVYGRITVRFCHFLRMYPPKTPCFILGPARIIAASGDFGLHFQQKSLFCLSNIPDGFLQNIFITIPKVNMAQDCNDFRTISLISHMSKILLHLINNRITPIIEQHLSDTQKGFHKGKGTRDATFQLRMIAERSIQVNKKVYA